MICSHCKREFPDSQIDTINGKNYCPFCGRELVESPHTHEVNGRKHPKGTDRSLTVLTALTAVLCAALVALLLLPGRKDSGSGTVAENTETETPAQEAETPAQETETPAQETEEPVQETEEPVQEIEEPAQETETPVQEQDEVQHPIPAEPLSKDKYVLDGHTYALYDADYYDLNSYNAVRQFCNQQGGYLAVINSQEENDFIFNMVTEKSDKTAFFGYSDKDAEGNWTWGSGSSNYENWTRTDDVFQPDNGYNYEGDEDYAEFNYEKGTDCPNDGTWNDAPFRENTDLFICEWDYEVDF